MDIDHFKDVNDTYGHDAGDEALRQVANVIQSDTRGIDTGARIGGDEFAVILPETDLERGIEVAGRLRASIAALDFGPAGRVTARSEEHTSELQSRQYLVCRLLLEKKKKKK